LNTFTRQVLPGSSRPAETEPTRPARVPIRKGANTTNQAMVTYYGIFRVFGDLRQPGISIGRSGRPGTG